jgi:hypothetical protein
VRAGLLELVDRAMRERTRATPADNERKKN